MVMIKRGRERQTLVDSEDSFAYKLAVQKTSKEFKTDPRGSTGSKMPEGKRQSKNFLSHARYRSQNF